MKIVCENCNAKYSIADEKVMGKVFKIRCKKCGESIVVRGDTPDANPEISHEPAPASQDPFGKAVLQSKPKKDEIDTKVFDYASRPGEEGPVWHIVVDEQQQGPYTTSQIREYLAAGSLSLETYIWKEGFEDWIPIKNVAELAKQTGASFPSAMEPSEPFPQEPAAKGGGLFDAPAPGALSGGLFASSSDGGLFGSGGFGKETETASPFDAKEGLFGGSKTAGKGENEDVFSSTYSAPSTGGLFNAGDKKADGAGGIFAQGDGDAGNDLFGDSAGGTGRGGDRLFSQAADEQPGPRMDINRMMMTGQRNENSVLFSLASLQALAAGPSMDRSAPSASFTPTASGAGAEASGLIDIRSLAASLSADRDTGMDDLISMGGGGFAPALGAPILAPQRESMSLGVKIALIGGSVAVLAVIVILAVVLVSKDGDEETKQQLAMLQKQLADAQGSPVRPEPKNEPPKADAVVPQAPEQKPDTAAQAGDTEEKPKEDSDEKSSGSSKSGSSKSGKKSSSSQGSSSSSESTGQAGASQPESDAPPPKKTGGNDELDDLLGGSLAKPEKKPSSGGSSPTASGGGGGGDTAKKTLDRSDVQQGMSSVDDRVKRCGQGQQGTITLKVIIGSTGRVVSANPTGAFAGTPVGSCAARAVRGAVFPKSQSSLTVMYPFKL